MEEFREMLSKKLKQLNINIEEKQIENFYKYMNLLLEWNEKINLTAITKIDDIILKHFVDSLTILKYISENETIVDIGTGAGFPGVPIAIMRNNNITLVDSLNKRINFLNDVKEKLNMKNVNTIHLRAEEFGQDKKYRETFDVAVSRAVARLNILVEYLLPTVKLGGKVICMKGSDIKEELDEAKFAIKELGGKIIESQEFYLPETDMKRTIILIQKIKETPNKYPRKAGMPVKEPLK